MAIPSTTGTEVLRRGGIDNQSSSWTAFCFDGTSVAAGHQSSTVPANHIIIMLNMIFCEMGTASEAFKLYTNAVTLVESQAIPARGTFVWNDKFSLKGGEKLQVFISGGGNVDIYYSYIDQNWT